VILAAENRCAFYGTSAILAGTYVSGDGGAGCYVHVERTSGPPARRGSFYFACLQETLIELGTSATYLYDTPALNSTFCSAKPQLSVTPPVSSPPPPTPAPSPPSSILPDSLSPPNLTSKKHNPPPPSPSPVAPAPHKVTQAAPAVAPLSTEGASHPVVLAAVIIAVVAIALLGAFYRLRQLKQRPRPPMSMVLAAPARCPDNVAKAQTPSAAAHPVMGHQKFQWV